MLYGTGGIGKTSLSLLSPGPVGFLDLEDSLPKLPAELRKRARRINGVETWQDIRDALCAADIWAECKTVVIDSLSRAEEWAIAHTLATTPKENGQRVTSIEGYGYGKGYQHVYDTFLPLLADLDAHVRAGRNVVLVCHSCTARIPNPAGEDFIRWEPRLQTTKEGKASIRNAVKEWADEVSFISYDIAVSADGKAKGGGERTIYPAESAVWLAKGRTLKEPIIYTEGGTDYWTALKGGN